MGDRSKFLFHFEQFMEIYEKIIIEYKNELKKEETSNTKKIKRLAIYFKSFKEFHKNEKKNTEWYMKQFSTYYTSNTQKIINGDYSWLSEDTVNLYYKKNIKKTCLTLSGMYLIMKNRYVDEMPYFKYHIMRLLSFVIDDKHKEKIYLEIAELTDELEDNGIEIKEYSRTGYGDPSSNLASTFGDVAKQFFGDSELSTNLTEVFGKILSAESMPDGINALNQAISDNPGLFEQTQTVVQDIMPQLMGGDMMSGLGNVMSHMKPPPNKVEYSSKEL